MITAVRSRLSYANVMSTIAVFAAVGGGAYAATKTTSKTIKNNTIKSIDQKDRKAVQGVDVVPDSLTGGEILESSLVQVPSAATANSAATAGSAETADQADHADFASSAGNGIEGWALIRANGDRQITFSLPNVTVSRESEGVYCFNGLGPFVDGAVVTGDVSFGNAAQDNFFSVQTIFDSALCPGQESAVVESRDDIDTGAAALQDAGFYIVFY